jgi:hypothetical protein
MNQVFFITGSLQCLECGTTFLEHEAPTDDEVKGKFKRQQTQIITAKSKTKKHYDQQGNLITDPDLIDLIEGGGITVISYREDKVATEEQTKRIVRKR